MSPSRMSSSLIADRSPRPAAAQPHVILHALCLSFGTEMKIKMDSAVGFVSLSFVRQAMLPLMEILVVVEDRLV